MIQIIDNKKVDLTDHEFTHYQKIVKSNTTSTNKGENLFIDLFETDDKGIIIYLKPPRTAMTSFEVFLFLMAIMQHQHLRKMSDKVDALCAKISSELDALKKESK